MPYIHFNNNPKQKNVGDCVIRAISCVMDIPWIRAYMDLCNEGLELADMPNSNCVWGAYLRKNGFRRYNTDCTVDEFARQNPYGVYVLSTGNHVVACIDGDYMDAWDSGYEVIDSYWRKEF